MTEISRTQRMSIMTSAETVTPKVIKAIIDNKSTTPIIAGIILHILCTNNGFPFFSWSKSMIENPQITKMTVKNIMTILGAINELIKENNLTSCAAKTLLMTISRVNTAHTSN